MYLGNGDRGDPGHRHQNFRRNLPLRADGPHCRHHLLLRRHRRKRRRRKRPLGRGFGDSHQQPDGTRRTHGRDRHPRGRKRRPSPGIRSVDATAYNIYWATTTGVTPATGTKISNATSPFVQTAPTAGTTYFYVVTAENAVGESDPSAEVSATPTATATVPSAPTGVTATPGPPAR